MEPILQFWADYPELAERKGKNPVTYTIAFTPLAVSAASQGQFVQTANVDFVCTRIIGVQTTATTNLAYITTPLLVQLVITAINFNFNSTLTEWTTSGIGVNPAASANSGRLDYPFFIPKSSTITANVLNPEAVAANVFITFIGVQCPG